MKTHIEMTHEDVNVLLDAQQNMTAKQQQQLNLRLCRTDNDTWCSQLTADKADKLINTLHFFCFTASTQQRKQAQALQKKLTACKQHISTHKTIQT